MQPGRWQLPEGAQGLAEFGHRTYVGGKWDTMGQLQFDFLVGQGLRPDHYLLDIACGSLRAGRLLIPYLDAGHYLGLDKEEALISAGLANELDRKVVEEKKPQFVVSASFEFRRFEAFPDFALAQSLFTHLPPGMITTCLANLREVIAADGVFFATIFEIEQERRKPRSSHDHAVFRYTLAQMASLGEATGWAMDYIGDWGHPKGQRMLRYRPV